MNANLAWIIGGTFGALGVGTGVRLLALRNATIEVSQKRLASLQVWWILAILWSVAAIFGKIGATVLLAVAAILAMREFLSLVARPSQIGRLTISMLICGGILLYGMLLFGQADLARWTIPILGLMVIGFIRTTSCRTNDYLRISSSVYLGFMLLVYAPAHLLFFFDLTPTPLVGPAGWFLFLLIVTEMNDIMQAIVGRKFGKTKITPEVSPNKSLEGLLGGVVTSIVIAMALAPVLTTIIAGRGLIESLLISLACGVSISVSGFIGDINMSAIKRDAGVKDGSSLLPGMGGVIDRIDSLTFTAPTFFYFVYFLERFSS